MRPKTVAVVSESAFVPNLVETAPMSEIISAALDVPHLVKILVTSVRKAWVSV